MFFSRPNLRIGNAVIVPGQKLNRSGYLSSLHETGLCKYVWCKKGVIRLKREEGHRTYIVRSDEGIEKLICEYSEQDCIEKEDEDLKTMRFTTNCAMGKEVVVSSYTPIKV
ncbi:unnamed protein product [Leptosia nina]|uniref:FP protein C-terminal domain-containing protein n=1 Tax=Leptosia nina TaxID=320188 RepID=A0AAV1JEZ5_9NEOP